MLDAAANEVGLGFAATSAPGPYTPSSFTFGTTDKRLRSVNTVWVWPSDKATDVPTHFYPATENPNPLPDIAKDNTIAVGPPAMFCLDADVSIPLEITKFHLSEDGSTKSIRARLLHHSKIKVTTGTGFESKVDPNLNTRGDPNCVFIVPLDPLSTNTRYEVSVEALRGSEHISNNWIFSTTP